MDPNLDFKIRQKCHEMGKYKCDLILADALLNFLFDVVILMDPKGSF